MPDKKSGEMNNSPRMDILIRSLRATLGLMLYAVGVYLVIQANLGATPWDVLNLGLAKTLGWLYGDVSVAVSVVIILIDVLVLREKIGIGTILDAIVVGKTVDLLNWMNLIPTMTGGLVMRIIILLLGFCLQGLAQYLYMKEALSYGPRDTLQIGLGRIMKKVPIGVVNIILLAVVLTIGYLLGGKIGVASFIAPIGIGLTQQGAFAIMKFKPKEVVNQNIIESFRIIFRRTEQ